MSNLFSSFEPKALFSLSINWSIATLVLLYIPLNFWMNPPSSKLITKTFLSLIANELKAILPPYTSPGFLLIPMTLFFYIFLNNFLSLFPYVFTNASHLSFSLSLALPLWLGYMVYSFTLSNLQMMAHLVPAGTPAPLMPLMVLIELLSSLIRPITLSVRLSANLIAGHLLLTLLSNQMYFSSLGVLSLLLCVLLALVLLEVFVSFIQSYVFCILSTLYSNEANSVSIQ